MIKELDEDSKKFVLELFESRCRALGLNRLKEQYSFFAGVSTVLGALGYRLPDEWVQALFQEEDITKCS